MNSLVPDTTSPATLLSRRFRPDQIPSLAGRVALVTGGSAGIGYYDALALARAGARVLIASSDPAHGKQAETDINQALKDQKYTGSVEWHQVDFGRLRDVDAFAKGVAEREERLDILICNAGIGQAPFGLTEDGLERHFEVNNLAHYVLILRVLPLIKKTAQIAPPTTVRIVLQSSEMHRFAPSSAQFLSKAEINVPPTEDGSQLYGRTKLGLIYLGRELVRRKLSDLPPATPVLVLSVHPGTVDTDVQKQWTESYGTFGKVLSVLSRTFGKTAEEGAEASLWAATSSDINERNWKDFQGNYYSEPYGTPGTESKQATDKQISQNFWALCATLSKEILGEELY